MSSLVILNPNSGRGAGAKAESTIRKSLDADLWRTEGRGHAQDLAQKAMGAGFTTIYAAGGDGTVNEVLNGLDLSQATLGILPVGTGNDLCRHLGITTLEEGIKVALAGHTTLVDVGKLVSSKGERLFLNVAGCGFDAAVAEAINRGYKFLSGRTAYIAALLGQLVSFRSPDLVVKGQDQVIYQGRGMLCSVANSSSYGGGMKVAPLADLTDGRLDAVIVHHLSKIRFLREFPQVFAGSHLGLDVVTFRQDQGFTVQTTPEMPVLVDGEIWGSTPVSYSLMPSALTLLAKKDFTGTL
ncbi:MAG: diacylglycerol kinase family lipid kinase [Fimbriimonadaceae bacterium]|jgi:diacylglycerol kinase (ATP)|nr:diacylglycerol kinase family lipid kinase [Fimbriimonadaceae bacterium]